MEAGDVRVGISFFFSLFVVPLTDHSYLINTK